jgi:peptidyl-prolyl cis-trans isomerase D
MPFDVVKDKVKEAYLHQTAEEKFSDLREKLANITYEHPDSLQPAVSELGLTIQTSELFSREKGGKDISSLNKIREAAFSNDVLNLQNNSDVIQENPDAAVVIHLKSHLPSSLLSLKAVQQQIMDKLKASEVDAKTLHYATELKKKLSDSSDPDQVVKSYNLTWSLVGFTPRHATTVNSAILNTAFEMPKPTQKEKITFSIAKLPNGYAVIGLKAVKDGALQSTEETNVYEEQIQNTQGLLEYELYKQSLLNQAKITNK